MLYLAMEKSDAVTRLTASDAPLSRVQDDSSVTYTDAEQSLTELGDWKLHKYLSGTEYVTEPFATSVNPALGTLKSLKQLRGVSRSPFRSLSPPLPRMKTRLLKLAMVTLIALFTIVAARTLKIRASGVTIGGVHIAKALEGKRQMQFGQDKMHAEEAQRRDVAKGWLVNGSNFIAQNAKSEKGVREDRDAALDALQSFLDSLGPK